MHIVPQSVLRQWWTNFQNNYQQYYKTANSDGMLSVFCSLDGVTQNLANVNAIGNYLTPTTLSITPATNEVMRLHRLLVYIQGQGALGSGKYGPIPALTNGVKISYTQSSVETVLTPIPVATSGQWKMYCFDTDPISFGAGDNLDAARWSLDKSAHSPLLFNETNDSFNITLEDNFSALTLHTFLIQGQYFRLGKD